MKIISELSLEEFETWGGATDTKNAIIDAGKESEFENYIEDLYPDGLTDTELNDILWFDRDFIYEHLGLNEDREIEEEQYSIQGAKYRVITSDTDFMENSIVISLEDDDSIPLCVLQEDFKGSFDISDYEDEDYYSVDMEDLELIEE